MAFSLRRLLTKRIDPVGPPPRWLQWLVLIGFAVAVSPIVYFVVARMKHQRSTARQIELRQQERALKVDLPDTAVPEKEADGKDVEKR